MGGMLRLNERSGTWGGSHNKIGKGEGWLTNKGKTGKNARIKRVGCFVVGCNYAKETRKKQQNRGKINIR